MQQPIASPLRLEFTKFSLINEPSRAVLTFRDESLEWNAQLFDRASYSGEFDVFEQINGFWRDRLTEAEQEAVFNIYKECWLAFENMGKTENLTMKLYHYVQKLYEYHPLEVLGPYLNFYQQLRIPESVTRASQQQGEVSFSSDRTYGPDDYIGLRTLSVALRVMIPIWGQFIYSTKGQISNTFKEMEAYQLLAYTNLASSPAMEKLRVFVEKSVPPEKSKASSILRGLASDDFPIWMLGLVLVRRLSVGDVRGIDPTSNLITFIFRYIDHKAKTHDNSFEGTVKEKIVEGAGQDGENNLSKLEGYKIKPELPAGDIAFISAYAADPLWIARKLEPLIPEELVHESVNSVQALTDKELHKPQIALVQWTLNEVIPARGIWLLTKPLILNTIAATQALLWHRGHRDLAALVSAMELDQDDDAHMAYGNDTVKRPTAEQLEKLNYYYPYARRMGKQKTQKQPNVARDAIESVAASFGKHIWRLTVPADWLEVLRGNRSASRRFITPADIRVKLADFIIAINDKTTQQGA